MFEDCYKHYKKIGYRSLKEYNKINKYINYLRIYCVACFCTMPLPIWAYYEKHGWLVISSIVFYGGYIFYGLVISRIVINRTIQDIEHNIFNNQQKIRLLGSIPKEKFSKYKNEDVKKMYQYLKNTYVDRSCANRLMDQINKKIDNAKPKFPVIPALCIALFASLWNNFFTWLYKSDNVNSIASAILVFFIGIVIIIVGTTLYHLTKELIVSVQEFLYGNEYEELKQFRGVISEIVIRD